MSRECSDHEPLDGYIACVATDLGRVLMLLRCRADGSVCVIVNVHKPGDPASLRQEQRSACLCNTG
jgi:hypothetical protein